jgi:uncharacterized protein (TIGR00290 family)
VTRPHRVVVSWSGGKDSAWLLHELRQRRDVEVVGLLTTLERGAAEDAPVVQAHEMAATWIEAQAAAAQLPIRMVELPREPSNDAYGDLVGAALRAARSELGAEVVAFGDLFLEDVRRWREGQAKKHGLAPAFPLFGRDTSKLARAMIAAGQRAVVVALDTTRLPRALLGRDYDEELLSVLPDGIDPCGENGEFHTLVWRSPAFAGEVPTTTHPTIEAVVDGRGGLAFAHPAAPTGPRGQPTIW